MNLTDDQIKAIINKGCGAMSLPNNMIFLPSDARGGSDELLALLFHEIDHQYLYQIDACASFYKLIAEANMATDPYDFRLHAGVQNTSDILSLNQIRTYEGQAQYIEDYVWAVLAGKDYSHYKIFQP